MACKMHFSPKNVPKNHPGSYKVMGQLWATNEQSSSATVTL